MCECLRVVFVSVSVFVHMFAYVHTCVCFSVFDVHMYVCLRMYVCA